VQANQSNGCRGQGFLANDPPLNQLSHSSALKPPFGSSVPCRCPAIGISQAEGQRNHVSQLPAHQENLAGAEGTVGEVQATEQPQVGFGHGEMSPDNLQRFIDEFVGPDQRLGVKARSPVLNCAVFSQHFGLE
jgi:hypothetical protein